jgi:hypothetical protein
MATQVRATGRSTDHEKRGLDAPDDHARKPLVAASAPSWAILSAPEARGNASIRRDSLADFAQQLRTELPKPHKQESASLVL